MLLFMLIQEFILHNTILSVPPWWRFSKPRWVVSFTYFIHLFIHVFKSQEGMCTCSKLHVLGQHQCWVSARSQAGLAIHLYYRHWWDQVWAVRWEVFLFAQPRDNSLGKSCIVGPNTGSGLGRLGFQSSLSCDDGWAAALIWPCTLESSLAMCFENN